MFYNTSSSKALVLWGYFYSPPPPCRAKTSFSRTKFFSVDAAYIVFSLQVAQTYFMPKDGKYFNNSPFSLYILTKISE